ncbi:MAG: methylmalonyl-CoA epimerase [Acetobacteraceae bacterium]|nr:methylmalonyl-CoA epimerase [Acetobacteraceae bacterium]
MIGRLNHVGIATPSIERSAALYRDVLGACRIHPTVIVPDQGVAACFIDLPNTQLELIEPYGPDSPLTSFLSRHPLGGQHHLCFEVADLRAAVAELQRRGFDLLGQGVPRIGAHGWPIVFLHPRTMNGGLTELMEQPKRPAEP